MTSDSFDHEIQWRVNELNAAHNRRNAEALTEQELAYQVQAVREREQEDEDKPWAI
jgi:hypothetical protein